MFVVPMIEILESKSISVKIFDLFLKSIFWHQGPNLYKHFRILESIPWEFSLGVDGASADWSSSRKIGIIIYYFMTEGQS